MRFNLFVMLALTALLTLAPAPNASAQRGDRKDNNGQGQPEVWKQMDVPAAPVLTPAQALAAFKVAPGYRVELVAAEPLVVDPVAMTWDEQGRLWVVEMRGYMPDVDGTGEDQPLGQIVVLEDQNQDGQMDKSTVFLDKLVMPRAIAIVQGGVLISEPPNLLFCRDTNNDLKCDDKQIVYNEYGIQGPVEHTDNALMWGLDNKLYNAKSNEKYQFKNGKLTVHEDVFRGQWGLARDNFGRLFGNSNSNYLSGDLIPGHYATRNPAYDNLKGAYTNIIPYKDVHSIRVNPGVNRGYKEQTLKADGRLAGITAVSGLAINRSNRYAPEMANAAFIPEPGANVVTAHTLQNNGVKIEASHLTFPDTQWGHREILASTDERFRPVSAYPGPDGYIYVTDMYRGILQHVRYVTTFLRKQIIERGLDEPVGRGRIWRIVPDGPKPKDAHAAVDFGAMNTRELIHELNNPNGWRRDTAQRILVQNASADAVEPLRSLATYGDAPLTRIHALWTLEGMSHINTAVVMQALNDRHPRVRITGAQLAEDLADSAGRALLVEQLIKMISDKDEAVRVQVMLSLGAFNADTNVRNAMIKLLLADNKNTYLPGAAISGLSGFELNFLEQILKNSATAKETSELKGTLSDLAATIMRTRKAESVEGLLAVITTQNDWRRDAMLNGMAGASKNAKPIKLNAQPLAFLKLEGKAAIATHKLITWKGDSAAASRPVVAPLTAEEQKLFDHGKMVYMVVCMACHQITGKGQPGMAPTLVQTDFVLGSKERLTRIALNGLMGPVTVNGEEWNLAMPGHRENPAANDKNLAAILTYIRRAWGNEASPVTIEEVAKTRADTDGQVDLYTIEQLEEFK